MNIAPISSAAYPPSAARIIMTPGPPPIITAAPFTPAAQQQAQAITVGDHPQIGPSSARPQPAPAQTGTKTHASQAPRHPHLGRVVNIVA